MNAKQRWSCLVVVAFIWLSVSGWLVWDRSSGGVSEDAPTLVVSPAAIDFGECSSEDERSLGAEIKNTGQATVDVVAISSNCGCTVASGGRGELEPGQVRQIEITFDPERFRGRVERSVFIHYRAPGRPHTTRFFELIVTADVEPTGEKSG